MGNQARISRIGPGYLMVITLGPLHDLTGLAVKGAGLRAKSQARFQWVKRFTRKRLGFELCATGHGSFERDGGIYEIGGLVKRKLFDYFALSGFASSIHGRVQPQAFR